MSSSLRRLGGRLVAVAIGVILSALVLEVGLRAAGHGPWRDSNPPASGEPALHEPDAQLGWKNKTGAFVWRGRASLPPIHLTFWPGGRRATGPEPTARAAVALLLGGSYMQGWAVSDSDTLGWRLQLAFPDVEFANFGTAGYGTTQSLLVLENELASRARAPVLAIYGVLGEHLLRNVAHPVWLRGLASSASADGFEPRVPFATFSQGKLRLHLPLGYPNWPFKRASSAVAFLEERWFSLTSRSRTGNEFEVTEALVVEMARSTKRAGTHLLVVALAGTGPALLRRLQDHGIDTIDCAHPRLGEAGFRVPVYGHPNARVNAHWARCISEHLHDTGLLRRAADSDQSRG